MATSIHGSSGIQAKGFRHRVLPVLLYLKESFHAPPHQMISIPLCRSSRITWQGIVVAAAIAMLISGIITFIFYLSIARGEKQNLSDLKPEPVLVGANNTFSHFDADDRNMTFCPKPRFPCNNSSRTCLGLEKRCDGRVDCPQAEDELNCVCASRMSPKKFCDKYPDCFDESDESFCSYCPKGYFNCDDGKCIPRMLVCDSRVDCDNFMDENFCFRLSSVVTLHEGEGSDPIDSSSATGVSKTGFLHRNRNGVWYPVCANPIDYMQDALASFACVSITANPLAGSTHQYKPFEDALLYRPGNYIYHYMGRFIKWNQCVTQKGIFITCDDVRCGFNPKHLLPRKRKGRIVGGEVSEPGAWPWHGAIYKNGSYACGATLITHKWLISAAHCFIGYKQNYYEVQLGMMRRKSFTPHQKTYRIDRVVPHRNFSVVTLEFDIVMLRMAEPVMFDFWVRPICLPDRQKVENSGSFCTAIGWGDTGETADDSEDLQEVHVPLTESCKRDPKRWLCAGYAEGGRDACQGDSGGPLMCLQDDQISWYIAGVISAGRGCARPKTPGMYTRVVYFLDWIKQVIFSSNKAYKPLATCPGWKCAAVGGGNCLAADRVCDGHVDCYDAQDEANCIKEKTLKKF